MLVPRGAAQARPGRSILPTLPGWLSGYARVRTDEEFAAALAAAEQRLARAADAFNAAGAELDALTREALRRGMPVPTAGRGTDDTASSPRRSAAIGVARQ
ncbi:hypothetical protein [Streptomyces sp. GC420]|uniref:hypothetical protein n=1 Tax=Streptomyces sp. GC420 TaxID=2697568 RepID=UPI001FB734BF|nr:hypothetical protein [Streptomyces sp. GC420]